MQTALVHIWGNLVGAVLWNDETGLASFEYEPSFLGTAWELSPLKMPKQRGAIYSFPELRGNTTFSGLPGLLADVLPDRYGNQLIDIWLARQGRPANSMNPVEKLCFIGTRGMGALEFEPAVPKAGQNTFKIEVDSLVAIVDELLQNRERFATNLSDDQQKAVSDILKVGTSAGGMRAKAIIAYNPKTGEVRSGQTKAPNDFEHWLLKLDGTEGSELGKSSGYGRVEMAYHLMAQACEIEMMECRLLEENGRAHFITKRFDREGGSTKHHIQTLCGIQHWDYNLVGQYSYEQAFQTMRQLGLPYPAAEQLFRRMVFNVLGLNRDDHTKNFAFRLKQNGAWELSPAYDLCFAYNSVSPWVSQHALSVNGKRENITTDDMLAVAKAMSIKKGVAILNSIKDTVAHWPAFAETTGVPSSLRDAISTKIGEAK